MAASCASAGEGSRPASRPAETSASWASCRFSPACNNCNWTKIQLSKTARRPRRSDVSPVVLGSGQATQREDRREPHALRHGGPSIAPGSTPHGCVGGPGRGSLGEAMVSRTLRRVLVSTVGIMMPRKMLGRWVSRTGEAPREFRTTPPLQEWCSRQSRGVSVGVRPFL